MDIHFLTLFKPFENEPLSFYYNLLINVQYHTKMFEMNFCTNIPSIV